MIAKACEACTKPFLAAPSGEQWFIGTFHGVNLFSEKPICPQCFTAWALWYLPNRK